MTIGDRCAEVLKLYGFEMESMSRGRGCFVCVTDQGIKSLREYRGTAKRVEFEEQVLERLSLMGEGLGLRVDRYLKNLEGGLVTAAGDQTRYVCQDWISDRECSLKDAMELYDVVEMIAKLHRLLRLIPFEEGWTMGSTAPRQTLEDMTRHVREMKRTRAFIRQKRGKTEFELCVMETFPEFFSQAEAAEQGFLRLADSGALKAYLCHGNLDQHHILIGRGSMAIVEYNGLHLGQQMEDLYRFLRKAMEKHNWDLQLMQRLLRCYEIILPLTPAEKSCLYHLFLFPEKYWKQLNYYFNASKAWIPARNTEKLKRLKQQEPDRQRFLHGLAVYCKSDE